MRFTLSDEQLEIQRTAKDLLAKRAGWPALREAAEAGRYDDALWGELAGLGWTGIALPEDQGGGGLGVVDLAVLLEQLGYACAAVPFTGTVLAGLAIATAGSDEQRERWLPGLASGELRGALGPAGGLVPDAPGADVVVLAGSDGGLTLTTGATVEAVETVDPTRRYGRVDGDPGEELAGDTRAALDRALVAVSAGLVGVCQRALDMTLEYVGDRKQFGVPVGSFQAVQHKAAEMLLQTEGGRSATFYAAWTADAEPERLPMAAAMAKAWTSDAARQVTSSAIQLHGGIGFTWEADVHWLFKRAQLDAALLGATGPHRARIAALVARERAVVARG